MKKKMKHLIAVMMLSLIHISNPMKTTLAFYTRSLELGARYITGAKVKAIEKVKGKARKEMCIRDSVTGTFAKGSTSPRRRDVIKSLL